MIIIIMLHKINTNNINNTKNTKKYIIYIIKMNLSEEPQSPPSSRMHTRKRPSTDPRKKRENACLDNDYVATKRNDNGKLICDDGSTEMYFHQSSFDKSINKKSSFSKGVWCCEKEKIHSTQVNKRKEAEYRKYLLFMKEQEEEQMKKKSARRRLLLKNHNFQVPSLPRNHPRYIRQTSSHIINQAPPQTNEPSENNSFISELSVDSEWDPLFSTPPKDHTSPQRNTSILKLSSKKRKKNGNRNDINENNGNNISSSQKRIKKTKRNNKSPPKK
jgi:hypothetical protein